MRIIVTSSEMDHIGRYQIVGELGRGAMGVVYRALDPSIGREVAIKTIRLGDLNNAEQRGKQRERLFREARSAGILSHPGIVTIYDMAEQNDLAYIAMEFVSGPTLEQLLSAKDPIEPAFLSSLLRQIAVALDYAHHKGIVHRDIKPANIIVTEAGVSKIADFGIAKVSAADQLTQTGLIVGTPNYMAPEQVQGKQVDGFADQYSLAVMAYEMLTGEKPFVAEHLTTLVYQIVCEAPPTAQRLNPTLGPQIEAVLQRGLSKLKEARFPSCTAFVDALEAACAATPGWKNLGRGASLNLPTLMLEDQQAPQAPPVVEVDKAPVLPPPPVRTLPAPHVRQEPEATRRVAPILITLLLGGALAVGAYYSRQWIYPETAAVPEPPKPALRQEPPTTKPIEPVQPPPAPLEPTPAPVKVEPAPAPETNDGTPEEPASPAREAQVPGATARREPLRPPRVVTSVEVTVQSQPSGATAMLDGLPGTSCITPCVLKASSGEHMISLTHAGYKMLTRAVAVHDTTVELPVLNLTQAAGTLMVQSHPDGATILVDDRRWPQPTPAQLTLAPGRYRLTLEKGNLKAFQTIEVRDGDLRHLILQLSAQ
jgi:serine/threonine protein kinase